MTNFDNENGTVQPQEGQQPKTPQKPEGLNWGEYLKTPEGQQLAQYVDLIKDDAGNITGVQPKQAEPTSREEDLKTINESFDTADNSVESMIGELTKNHEAYKTEMEDRIKANKKAQLFGGIAEAASALTNVIGTIAGGSPMTITSQQQAWARRADALRKEKEQGLRSYRTQMATLNKTKADLTAKRTAAVNQYNRQADTKEAQDARFSVQAFNAIVKAQSAFAKENEKYAKAEDAVKKSIGTVAASLLRTYLKDAKDRGLPMTDALRDKLADDALKKACEFHGLGEGTDLFAGI